MPNERRSRSEQRQHTRSELLEATFRVLLERGYAETTLDHIAAEAGYTKGAIYSNFSSKEELILEMWRGRFDSNRAGSDRFSKLLVDGEFDAARDLLTEAVDDEAALPVRVLFLETWVHAIRNASFRDDFAAAMRAQREQVRDVAIDLYARDGHPGPRRADDLAKIALACEVGLGMLNAIEPETSPSLYVDCLAALMGQSPFVAESA